MLGWGLLGGGGAIVLLMLAWLSVSGAQGGGIVLGLILMLFLAGPLVGAGAYVLSRQRAEAAEAAAFGVRRRVIDADRLFRAEIGASLRQLASSPALPGERLRALADELQNPVHTGVEWQSTVQLNDNQVEVLGRYDDLVRERVRRLRDGAGNPEAALRELREAIDQREDLLVMGRAAPTLQPAELMRTDAPRQVDLESIGVGDAVSRERTNYVVESVAAYFAEGQSWKLARLAPTSDADRPRWLYVGPASVEVALLDEHTPPPSEALPNTAVVDVTSRTGTARGILVSWSRRRDGDQLSLVERWPDNTSHAYRGPLLKPGDLDVWPAQASPQARNATLPHL
jgi:hypothetical protein